MSRRLGQGVVTGLDRSFISTVATYLELPVMLMSSFFSSSVDHDDDFLDFVLFISGNWKEVSYISMKWLIKNDPINLISLLKIERTAWLLLKPSDPMVFSLSDGQRDSFVSIRG